MDQQYNVHLAVVVGLIVLPVPPAREQQQHTTTTVAGSGLTGLSGTLKLHKPA
jgi:hypothetical protein